MTDTAARALRQHFLDYFARHGHAVVKSYPLIPANDPTLMFTNAGMVQFKDVFTGAEKRPYSRATSSQKCMRVSGKHNDLEEVGRTARHHTFFEMLGNFSFGDYFKEEAIDLAWKFITDEMALDTSRLWVTVFGGEGELKADDEARSLWKKISGLPESRILDMGMKDNFWAMGDTGPCGPCTEIHYDLGGEGDPTLEDFETGRMVEIWNNVFMQFERKKSGEMIPLPAPSVDTGMGLERLVAVVQGKDSNYHTDLFLPVLETVAEAAGKPYRRSDSEDDVSMRVIADHARATAFLVADGLQPGNTGRGYVMRRIMRRAIRHGKRLGFDDLFFHRACEAVVETMGDVFLELGEARTLIEKVAQNEEQSFRRTLDTGLKMLGDAIAATKKRGDKQLAGADAFKLYDTYGFPPDLTEVIAEEEGLTVDTEGFERKMAAQKEKSGGAEVGDEAVASVYKDLAGELGELTFIGYTHEDEALDSRAGTWRLRHDDGRDFLEVQTTVKALVRDGTRVDSADDGPVEVVVEPTPYYGESGGQAGDAGMLVDDDGLKVEILDSLKPVEGFTVSRGQVLSGSLRVGQAIWAGYEPAVRKATRAHHSATHLLHASLRGVIGDHVKQAGSLVDAEHLRFDYSHFEAPTAEQLRAIEEDANDRVAAKDAVVTEVLPFDAAREKGAIALFGEKYGDVVRVLSMGDSVEFCGGTHARNTADIGIVLVTREEAVASGVRRIEAEVAGAASRRILHTVERLQEVADIISGEVAPDREYDDTTLQAVHKAVRRYGELIAALGEAGVEAATRDGGTVTATAPTMPESYGFAAARTFRDAWQALTHMANTRGPEVRQIAERFADIDRGGILSAVAGMLEANRDNERRLDKVRQKALSSTAGDLLDAVKDIGGVKVLATRVDGIDGKALRGMADELRDKLGSGVLCLGGESGGKATLLVAVTQDLTQRFQAGNLVRELAPIIGGRGGGKPELAQAGGSDPAGLEELFGRLEGLVGGG